jgi:inorganic triphosphatase YgiF
MPIEMEMKLRIPNDLAAQRIFEDPMILNYMSGNIVQTPMTSRYYDTSANALSALRWSLRMRKEGDNSVVAMKTSAVDVTNLLIARNEWEYPCEDIYEAIPHLIGEGAPAQLGEIASQSRLLERCRIEFSRRSIILKMPQGVMVDLSIDKGVIYADGKTSPIHELEVELMFGPAEELEPLCELFTQKFQLERESLSKYERALRLIRSR